MVKSNGIYSPQNYLGEVTGNYYLMGNTDNDIEFIEGALKHNGFTDDKALWNYPLTEIKHIAENDLNVVLVDCLVWNEDIEQYENEYRWFEVPKDFKENK